MTVVTNPLKAVIHHQEMKPLIHNMTPVGRSIFLSSFPEVERRAASRLGLPFTGIVILNILGEEVQAEIETRDISAAGGYFRGDMCPEIGTQVRLLLQWPADQKYPELILNATGSVLRVERLSEKRWGFAVKFDEKRDSGKA